MGKYNKIDVLNSGFVRLVDSMGGDERIVQAARVSYGDGTKTKREDRALIKYLYDNKHTSPFEHVQFTFHVKAPIFIARQWMRHRTASINEISGRYSILQDEFYIPNFEDICVQSKDNKQGRGESVNPLLAKEVQEYIKISQECSYKTYQSLLENGVSREIARMVLPLNIYTQWYWSIDLHNLMHFLRLRLHSHAQLEIRNYAKAIVSLIEPVVPVVMEIFKNDIGGVDD